MTLNSIQKDFGGFDPKFLGIIVRFEKHSLYNTFIKICSLDRDPDEVIKIGDHALMSSPEEAFECFSLGTTIMHEARHFHDSILSPFGNHLFRLRIQAAINGLQAIGVCKKDRKILPVPITTWRKLSQNEIGSLYEKWSLLLDFNKKDLVLNLEENDEELIKTTEVLYKGIKNIVTNYEHLSLPFPLQPSQIFEASAILVQIQNVFSVFGEEHSQLFLDRLLKYDDALPYVVPIKLLLNLFSSKKYPIDTAVLSAIITWCILGDFQADSWDACPANRFVKLFEHLGKNGLPNLDFSVKQVFNEWSEKLALSPIKVGLKKMIEANERLNDRFMNLPPQHKESLPDFSEAIASFFKANKYMVSKFTEDPDKYVRPNEYQENFDNWVAAPIRIDLSGIGIVGSEDALCKIFNVRKAVKVDDNDLAVLRVLLKGPTPGVEMIDPLIACNMNDYMNLSDFCFSEFFRDEPDFDIVRQVLIRKGTLPMEILS